MADAEWGALRIVRWLPRADKGIDRSRCRRCPYLERVLAWAVIATVFFLPVSEALKNIAYVVSLALYVIIILVGRERVVVPPVGWLFLSFLGATVLSAAVSAHPGRAITGVWEVFRFTSFFFVVERGVREERHVHAVLWATVAGLGVTVLVIVFRYLVLGLAQYPALSLGSHNAAAEYALMGLALMFGMCLHAKPAGWRFIGLIAVATLGVIFLAIMHSRMVWGGFILVGLLLGWLRRARVALTVVAVSVLLVLGVAAVKPEVWSQVVSLGNIENYKGVGGGGVRVALWKRAVVMWRDAPWLGVGPRAFMLDPDPVLDPQRSKYGFGKDGIEVGQVHNLWFHTAVEMGSIGVLILAFVFVYLGVWLLRSRQRFQASWPAAVWDGAFGSWMAILVAGLIEPSFGREHAMLFLMLLALLHSESAGWRRTPAGYSRRTLAQGVSDSVDSNRVCNDGPAREEAGSGGN